MVAPCEKVGELVFRRQSVDFGWLSIHHLVVMTGVPTAPAGASHIQIIPMAIEWVEGFREALGSVANEKRYILTTETPPLNKVYDYIRKMLGDGNPFYIAAQERQVFGWCDIKRASHPALWHSGTLGMGVVAGFRRQGFGRRLLETCLAEAWRRDFERVELMVYCDNQAAIRLYEKLGFEIEGRAKKYARIGGRYVDAQRMACVRGGSSSK